MFSNNSYGFKLQRVLRYEVELLLSFTNALIGRISKNKVYLSFLHYDGFSSILQFNGQDTYYMKYIYNNGLKKFFDPNNYWEIRNSWGTFNYRFNYSYSGNKSIFIAGCDLKNMAITDFKCDSFYLINCFFNLSLQETICQSSSAYTLEYSYFDCKHILIKDISPSIKILAKRTLYSNHNMKIEKIGRKRISWKKYINDTYLKINKRFVYQMEKCVNG